MNRKFTRTFLVILFLGVILILFWVGKSTQAQEEGFSPLVIGKLRDRQNQPVGGALVTLVDSGENKSLAETTTEADGLFAITLSDVLTQGASETGNTGDSVFPLTDYFPDTLTIHIERAHFAEDNIPLTPAEIQQLRTGDTVTLPETTLQRRISIAFWLAAVIFVVVLILIATGKLHNTLSALVGAALLLMISYLGHPINENLFIYDFRGALGYIDWNVIFLIMGMMIVIAVVEETGIFQWLAYMAYRVSGGRMWLLLPILMLITGVTSALLDNVTTMLLMTPITVQIALSVGINPLTLLIPEVLASNVIGISTLIGTPTNILIGSYGRISFTDFFVNLTPGVLMAFIGLVIYSFIIYRKDLSAARDVSPKLMEILAERARITEREHLKKAGWVGFGMLFLFVFGERIHLLPAVTALVGATALLVWIRPDIEEMIEAVDWTTLVFFIALFIVVGAIQEVGLIAIVAEAIGRFVGNNLAFAMLAVIWFSAMLSTVVANIPFTAAMLPVIGYLTATVPGAGNKALFFCLSVGSAMGGNGSLIGASANMVTAGIAERAGFPITYGHFLKKGFPALLVTVGLATLWLLLEFL